MKIFIKYLIIAFITLGYISCYQDTPADNTKTEDNYQDDSTIEVINNGNYSPRVLDLIKNSQICTYIVMYAMKYYTMDDSSGVNELLMALVDAKKRGIEIKIILDNTTAVDYPETTNYLKSNLISYKVHPGTITTHAKLLIIDNSITVIGSHNWTESAFNSNNETSVVIYLKTVAEKEKDYFFDLYNKY